MKNVLYAYHKNMVAFSHAIKIFLKLSFNGDSFS